jgi:hypothetical protein
LRRSGFFEVKRAGIDAEIKAVGLSNKKWRSLTSGVPENIINSVIFSESSDKEVSLGTITVKEIFLDSSKAIPIRLVNFAFCILNQSEALLQKVLTKATI